MQEKEPKWISLVQDTRKVSKKINLQGRNTALWIFWGFRSIWSESFSSRIFCICDNRNVLPAIENIGLESSYSFQILETVIENFFEENQTQNQLLEHWNNFDHILDTGERLGSEREREPTQDFMLPSVILLIKIWFTLTVFIRFGVIFLPQDPINISLMSSTCQKKINFGPGEVGLACTAIRPAHSEGKFLKFKINQNGLKLPIIILDLWACNWHLACPALSLHNTR